VYVKADARVSYQQVLTVLSALSNHPLVLLTESTGTPKPGKLLPPYGVSFVIGTAMNSSVAGDNPQLIASSVIESCRFSSGRN